MDALDRFVDGLRERAFDWSIDNCMTAVADWVVSRSGRDPAVGLRAVPEHLARRMDVGAIAADRMDALGFARTDAPTRGDVAIVAVGAMPTAAICWGLGLWVVRPPAGVALARARLVIGWRL